MLARRCPRLQLAAVALGLALAFPACRARARVPEPTVSTTHLHVVVINGGGSRAQNYQSHFLHVQQLLRLLAGEGVRPAQVTVFDADGSDPAADMAVREIQPEADFWLLRGTRLEHVLGTQIVYANTELPGIRIEAAKKALIEAWFKSGGKRLRAGDTLLLYVTDHGAKNAEDTSNNRITLWGEKESISVRELGDLLGRLASGVRVVALMSQCYSGAFANLLSLHERDGLPTGAACGYFSSTPDRPAYGCYPENRGKDNVGHSFHFLDALERTLSLPASHLEVLYTDRTPDVPIRTSDVYLEQLLDKAAAAAGQPRPALVDELLRAAWRDKASWEPEIRLLDRIAHVFGIASPRSLTELDDQTKTLPDVSEQLGNHGKAWRAALDDLDEANLGRFLAARPDWSSRVESAAVTSLDDAGRRGLTAALLGDLVPFVREDAATDGRLRTLRDKGETASAAAYRMEVRLAVVLRLRTVLTALAGRLYLATRATPAERAAHEAIRVCEDLRLRAEPASTTPPSPEPFPPYDEDVQLTRAVLPAWMGINFRQAKDKTRDKHGLKSGAAVVLNVYPESPAKAAGLEVGDVVLGPPDHPFTEPRQIREWTMLSEIGRPQRLVVQRGEDRLQVTLVPQAWPMRLPELPGPPKVGSAAPPLSVGSYRGTLPASLASGSPHLLFFWATWCAPCKAAVPEVLAFEQERGTAVIAITDEGPEQLDPFFKSYKETFPATVASDELRRAFQAYAVSGTPTFVLVDGAGLVQSQSTGYTPEKSLGITGWSWTRQAGAPPAH